LHVARRADNRVARHRVVVRAVEVVGPLVNVLRPRLDDLAPGGTLGDTRHPARGQHPQHLLLRHLVRLADDQEVDQVVGVRQVCAVEGGRRDGPEEPERAEVVARFRNVGGVAVEALDEVTGPGAKGRGQAAIAAAEMDHQPSANTGSLKDPAGGSRLRGGQPRAGED